MRLGIHGVVEVLRVVAVDRDQRQVADIDALRRDRRVDLIAVGSPLRAPPRAKIRRGRSKRAMAASHGELDRLLGIETLA